jgi:hypothetical protein
MMLSAEANEEREARDLELQSELERVFEVYLGATGSEKQKAKAKYLAKLRDFSLRVLRGRGEYQCGEA